MSSPNSSIKPYILLVSAAVAMAFLAGFLSLSIMNAQIPATEPLTQIWEAKERFHKNHRPLQSFKLSEIYPIDSFSFIDPKNVFSHSHLHSYRTLKELYQAQFTCNKSDNALVQDPAIKKAWTWIRFRCGKIPELPNQFFETKPFFIPLGGTYVFQKLQLLDKNSMNETWIQNHLHLFHAMELKQLELLGFKLDFLHKIISELDPNTLQAFLEEDDLVLSQKYVFARPGRRVLSQLEPLNQSHELHSEGYAIYRRSDWNETFSKSHYIVSDVIGSDTTCIFQEGRLCWVVNATSPFSFIRWPSFLLFVFSLGFTGICTYLAVRNFQTKKLEEEKQKFVLQILTHELRTPISNLVLSSDEVMDYFDILPTSLQEALLRMGNSIGRLQRLTEMSNHYLFTDQKNHLLKSETQKVSSANKYIEEILSPYDGELTVHYLTRDAKIFIDPYWASICIRNLVENALIHGKKPVLVSLKCNNDLKTFEIAIEDSGKCVFQNLEEIAKPFRKSKESPGLGLGMTITMKIANSMRAKLLFQNNPTRFTLIFSEVLSE